MKKHLLFPLLSAVGGICGAVLRFLQNRSGFEPDTGLPIPGNPYALLLPGMLFLLAALTLLLCLRLPKEDLSDGFADAFSAHSKAGVMLAVAGIFLWCLSGAAGVLPVIMSHGELYTVTAAGLYYPVSAAAQRLELILAVALVISAACMFPAAATRRFKDFAATGNLLLVPVVYLVLRMTLSFREISISASQQAYYVELMAMVFLTLCLFRLSSFAFQGGSTRQFVLYSVMAAVLCITALVDAAALGDRLFYGGGACLAAGFLLMRLSAAADASASPM